jgi:glycosyltransferase involved in cell wall biosynthesis
MKIALIHDYLNEFGGAERVLLALSEIWPEAPIYTAFYRKNSSAYGRFKGKKIVTSWVHNIPFFSSYLHSPLRFLAPIIWGSFDFSKYDVVISSASWYVTKGFGTRGIKNNPSDEEKPVEICYCHTPPRWLYGYKTSIELQKYWPVKIYAKIVGAFMRIYDFKMAQKVNYFVANSKNVAGRIEKYYRRDSTVIYPPVEIPEITRVQKENYYLVISRIVGGKGLDLAVKTAVKLGINLKIAGSPAGYYTEYRKLQKLAKSNVEFLGHVDDNEMAKLYAGAKAFLALSEDEDFGITPVESMLAGTPVIAFRGGGYLESVVENKTGIFFDEPTVESLSRAIRNFNDLNHQGITAENCINQAKKFSSARFKKEMLEFVNEHAGTTRS